VPRVYDTFRAYEGIGEQIKTKKWKSRKI
jgi:hypothetical protein